MRIAWAVASLIAVSSGALADWQYSRWGMNVEQVIAASGGTAQPVRDIKDKRIDKKKRLVVGEVVIGTTKLPVDFYFEDNKLRLIRYDLGLEDGCAEKEAQFLEAFGAAEPKLNSTEFPGRNVIYVKSRIRTWTTESGDALEYRVIWFERPDLPGVKSKSLCMAAITPAGGDS
jgi:hypothetical protein